ncbi:MAG: hypothetical protein JWN86_2054 [Planctomycetota bacterium]|nr:hypothetical protein [Planctomycetota bacterium]
MRYRYLALASLAMAVAGCSRTGTNAGLTNGPPPGSGEKAAVRSDLPGAISSGATEAVPVDDTGSNAGTASPVGGTVGSKPEQPRNGASANAETVRANPPIKAGGEPNSAAGDTKPPERINTGTPRSPQ